MKNDDILYLEATPHAFLGDDLVNNISVKIKKLLAIPITA